MRMDGKRSFVKRCGSAALVGLTVLAAIGTGSSVQAQSLHKPKVNAPNRKGGTSATHTNTRAISQANRTFGLSLLRQLSTSEGTKNVLLSPYSVAQALSMAYSGAAGETKATMGTTLGYGALPLSDINAGTATLRSSLTGADPKVTVNVANAIWSKTGFTFAPNFTRTAKTAYGAKTGSLDFSSESAVLAINSWVRQNTRGKIDAIISRQDLTPATAAVLANAIYFKGSWQEQFHKRATRNGEFRRADGTTVTVPMMTKTDYLPVLEKDGMRAVALPYGNGRLRFFIFMPDAPLGKFVATITPGMWTEWIGSFRKKETLVSIPRFKMGYSAALNNPLQAMGMKPAFAVGADFRNMGTGDFYIGTVQHKAVMEINEEGAEAAAATAVVPTFSAPARPPYSFRVDRPFLCAIADTKTGALLFLGTVYDPTQEG